MSCHRSVLFSRRIGKTSVRGGRTSGQRGQTRDDLLLPEPVTRYIHRETNGCSVRLSVVWLEFSDSDGMALIILLRSLAAKPYDKTDAGKQRNGAGANPAENQQKLP